MDDYNACMSLIGELFSSLQAVDPGDGYASPPTEAYYPNKSNVENDPYYATAYSYMDGHAKDVFASFSKGHVLAVATLATEFADMHLSQE
jgi:hypothetical protein